MLAKIVGERCDKALLKLMPSRFGAAGWIARDTLLKRSTGQSPVLIQCCYLSSSLETVSAPVRLT